MRIGALSVAAACVFMSGGGRGDPVPSAELWSGGRLVPVEAMPVDMASEELQAVIRPVPAQYRNRMDGIDGLYVAEVAVRYELTADEPLEVPVVFPIIGGAKDVAFALAGKPVRVRMVRDVDVFAAYERDWESVIDRAIAGEPGLRALAARARRGKAELLRRYGRGGAGGVAAEAWNGYDLTTGAALTRRAESLGLGMGTDSLVTYLLDEWDDLYGGHAEERPGLARWGELWTKRTLAAALDPHVPDPVALWETVPVSWMRLRYPPPQTPAFVFAVAELPLAAGGNHFDVRFVQPLSVTLRSDPVTSEYAGWSHAFRFILRTARFWRSFGDLSAEVSLPRAAREVVMRPSGWQRTGLLGQTVRYRQQGLPRENLSVDFAAFAWRPQDDELAGALGVPPSQFTRTLRGAPLGTWPPDPESAYRHFLRGEVTQPLAGAARPLAAGVTLVLAAATVWLIRRARATSRTRRKHRHGDPG